MGDYICRSDFRKRLTERKLLNLIENAHSMDPFECKGCTFECFGTEKFEKHGGPDQRILFF